MSTAHRLKGTGIVWEGTPIQVVRMQDMLRDFSVEVAQHGLRLLIVHTDYGDPTIINLGDEVFVDEGDDNDSDSCQFGVIRAEEDWHGDAGHA